MLTNNYWPSKWYWFVAGDESRVYSSETGQFVPIEDATYQAWLTSNRYPSRIISKTELRNVFVQQSSDALAKFDANQTLP